MPPTTVYNHRYMMLGRPKGEVKRGIILRNTLIIKRARALLGSLPFRKNHPAPPSRPLFRLALWGTTSIPYNSPKLTCPFFRALRGTLEWALAAAA